MEEMNFFEFIFDKKCENGSFNLNDTQLKNSNKKINNASEKLYKLIKQRVHPKCKNQLIELINNKDDALADYYYRENQLYYLKGIEDAVSIFSSIINS